MHLTLWQSILHFLVEVVVFIVSLIYSKLVRALYKYWQQKTSSQGESVTHMASLWTLDVSF